MNIDTMKQWLEALENSQRFVEASANAKPLPGWGEQLDMAEAAITTLRTAIEAAEKQVPFGFITRSKVAVQDARKAMPDADPTWLWSAITFGTKNLERFESYDDLEVLRIYTTPPAAPAAPTQDDLPDFIAGAFGVSRGTAYDMMRDALKEAAQPAPVQGCDFCNHPQYAGAKCKNCGRETTAPVQGPNIGALGMPVNVPVTPPTAQRQWVELSKEQVRACFFRTPNPPQSSPPHWWEYNNPDYMAIYTLINAMLREKNGDQS